MDTKGIRDMAINLLLKDRILKSDVKAFVSLTQGLADAYDALSSLQTAQKNSMDQAKDIFGIVKDLRKLNAK